MKVIFALAGQNRHVPRDTTNLTSQVNQVAEQCPFVYVGETGFIFMVTGYSLDHVEHVIKHSLNQFLMSRWILFLNNTV
jgi:hypothetical protein